MLDIESLKWRHPQPFSLHPLSNSRNKVEQLLVPLLTYLTPEILLTEFYLANFIIHFTSSFKLVLYCYYHWYQLTHQLTFQKKNFARSKKIHQDRFYLSKAGLKNMVIFFHLLLHNQTWMFTLHIYCMNF